MVNSDGERKRVGPGEGGRLYFELLGIFFRHDPAGIDLDDNVDEYSPEVETVLPRLGEADGVESLTSVLHEEFAFWFSGDPGPRERYLPIAREVWERFQADAPMDAEYEQILGDWLELRSSWPSMEDTSVDDRGRISQAVTAFLAGYRPIPAWAVEAIEDFEAHARNSDLSTAPQTARQTAPQREFSDHLLTLVRKVRAAG
jgi:hypothetical protein